MLSLKLMNAPNQIANETIIVSIEYLNSHPVRVSIDIKNNTVDIRNGNTIEVVVDKYDWFRDTSVVKQIFVRRVNQLINRRGE